ncbi:hypothetical protein [Aeromonas dhakensis]|uniref:hypothetical protein n=1 Tax=Aeromonas dhakensis TaxID=196024 RepID=UPI0024412912|nr:hypothetical protein [Aeromonas dhakensis]
MENLDLSFEVVNSKDFSAKYTAGCSGDRSECCTRVCTRACIDDQEYNSSIDAWDKYLEINAGVLQY